MANRAQPYTILHKHYLRVPPTHLRVPLNPTDVEQDMGRYKHVHLLDANFLAHTIGFIVRHSMFAFVTPAIEISIFQDIYHFANQMSEM